MRDDATRIKLLEIISPYVLQFIF
jgi:hypothetical protein